MNQAINIAKNSVLNSRKILVLTALAFSLPAFCQNFVLEEPVINTQTIATESSDISQLKSYFTSTQNIKADFIQTIESPKGKEISQGKMKIMKPNKFYWDYQSPNKQKIISNGDKVWQYDIDLEQVSIRKRDELIGGAAMDILSGNNPENSFNISRSAKEFVPNILRTVAADEFYRLNPKNSAENYDQVWLAFKGKNLLAIAVENSSNQFSLLSFSNLLRNSAMSAKEFEFSPPKGVDVAE